MSETAQQRLSRLLSLVPWLLTHEGSTISETAQHFGVTPEQLVKDLNLLIVSGRPGYLHGDLLDIQFWDEGGHITVLDPQTLDHPVALNTEEVAALLVALQALAQIPGSHDREALISTAAKLSRALDQVPAIALQVNAGSDDVIARAAAHHQVVRIEYQSDLEAKPTSREIEPLRILLVAGKAYVEAWCRSAEAIRTFRLDRIVAAELTGEQFLRDDQRTSAGFLSSARTVTLEVRQRAGWILDLLNAEEISRTEETILVSLSVADDEWLMRLILMLGPELVEAPHEALQDARRLAAELMRSMGQSR